MSQNAPGSLFTSAVLHSSADQPTFTVMLKDYVTVNPRRLRLKINPRYGTDAVGDPFRATFHFFLSHNPGLCQGFAVVTSAFKTWTCVTGRACVHTAPVINNNPYCATLLACVELHRAVLKLQDYLSSKQACLRVTQSHRTLQRSQDLAAIVTGQPLEKHTEWIWHAALHSVRPTSRTGQKHHNSRVYGGNAQREKMQQKMHRWKV